MSRCACCACCACRVVRWMPNTAAGRLCGIGMLAFPMKVQHSQRPPSSCPGRAARRRRQPGEAAVLLAAAFSVDAWVHSPSLPPPGELLDANANLVLQLARPFAESPTIENLISIRPGQSVG